MKYYVTDHLLARLKERDITKEEVFYCLDNYVSDYPNKGRPGCHYYIGEVKGKKLKVLVNTVNGFVVTAFWLDSGQKRGVNQ